MDEQHLAFVDSHRADQAKSFSNTPAGEISVIAVVSGDGLGSIFQEELGATAILPGGDTMNPSVREILDIVENVPTQDVIFLPNNKNIIMAANLALEQTSKNLRIVNSKTIPQGIAAILEFNPEQGLDENSSRMENALSNVRTGEVVRAVREVTLNGIPVEAGQNIGLMDGELLVAGESHDDVLVSLLERAEVSEDDLVTIYWGGEISENDAKSAHMKVTEAFPDTEIELVLGGQPWYHYIVSIE
jgi:hypothetical protein